jgi:hypothetical protein
MRSGGMDFTIDHRVLAWPASKAGKTIVNNHLKKKHE